MRLLDARSFTLHSYFDDVPPYAILSHCWEEEEVVFSDLMDLDAAKKKKGFVKLEKTCERAIEDGFDYCWIDTCCIQKESSSELSEAINSMFAWYRSSSKCYAYLADVEDHHDLANSRWFKRAWTLQELLAPLHVTPSDLLKGQRQTQSADVQSHLQTENQNLQTAMEFFSREWKCLGTKGELSTTISDITGIPKEYLERARLEKASVSMRMSWAASRQATRSEDIAYSLLGIFDVNMPLLYGEGKTKAFRRLQEEIMKVSEDETIFAWESADFNPDGSSTDVLASDPGDFAEAKSLVPFASDDPVAPYSMTHRGLRIWLPLYDLHEPWKQSLGSHRPIRPLRSPVMVFVHQDSHVHQERKWAALRCHVAHDYNYYVMIPLRHVGADMYSRDPSTSVALVPTTMPLYGGNQIREIYIRNSRNSTISTSAHRRYGFFIRYLPDGYRIRGVMPKQAWDQKSNILQGANVSSGQQTWFASMSLTVDCYKTSHSTTGYTYVGLGCRFDQAEVPPMPRCYLDNEVHVFQQNDLSVERFHEIAITKEPRDQARMCLMTKDGERVDFNLALQVSTENIFGQPMFVVDFVHEALAPPKTT